MSAREKQLDGVLVEVYVRRPWRAVRSFNCSLCGSRVRLGALDFEGALKRHVEAEHPQLPLFGGGAS